MSAVSSSFATAAIIGKREIQEDSIGWSDETAGPDGRLPALSIVADGMGGHAAGEVASRIAVDSFIDAYRQASRGGPTTLIEALDSANNQIAGHVASHPETDGMGCTLIAVEISDDGSAYRWISVGDSLLLSVTADGINRINADHSYREERERLIAAGESLDGAPAPNVLRSALMGIDVPLIDDQVEWQAFSPGETLVIATDGIETLTFDRIATIVRGGQDADAIAEALVAAVEAVGRPRQDNTSVAVLRPEGSQTVSAPLPDLDEARTLPPVAPPPPLAAKPATAAGQPISPKPAKSGGTARTVIFTLIGVALAAIAAWTALTYRPLWFPFSQRPAATNDAAVSGASPPSGAEALDPAPANEAALVETPAVAADGNVDAGAAEERE